MWKSGVVLVALCSVAYAKDPPDVAAIKQLIASEATALTEAGDHADSKVFTKTATSSTPESDIGNHERGGLRGMLASYLVELKPSRIQVAMAGDGKSAWVTLDATTMTACDSCESAPGPKVRSSQLVVKVGSAWLVQTTMWSVGTADAKVNKEAKAGNQQAPEAVDDTGDATVRAALATLVTKGFDPALAKNKQLFAIGSAPGEVVAFNNLVPFFNKAWVGKLAVKGPVWTTVAPSGTTAVAMANVSLTKIDGKVTYAVPFRWLVVFDKDAAGVWQPVHAHFAVR